MITDMGPSAGQFMYNGQIPTMGMGMQITNIAPHHIQKAVSICNSSYKTIFVCPSTFVVPIKIQFISPAKINLRSICFRGISEFKSL